MPPNIGIYQLNAALLPNFCLSRNTRIEVMKPAIDFFLMNMARKHENVISHSEIKQIGA